MKNLKEKQGITLIALVVTIVVLLILAGVSIAMLTGDNGILSQAQNAKNQTEKAEDKERIKLAVNAAQISDNGFKELGQNSLQEELDKEFGEGKTSVRDNEDGSFIVNLRDDKKDYTVLSNGQIQDGVDWKDAMAKAKAPEEQETTSKNVIGIGTNGQAVNMDLWLYTFDSVTNGYGLNSKEVFQNTEYNTNGTNSETIRTAGYKGTETDGKNIIIPQYISEDGGKTYKSVTSLYRTFSNNKNITTVPLIPTTVTSMVATFENCTKLKECSMPSLVEDIRWCWNCSGIEKIKEIPNSVIYMEGSFSACNSLEYVNLKIPDKVKSLSGTFRNCINLKEANLILPEGLESMSLTLYYCTSLTKGPDVIPESVTDMGQTFEGDAKLTGEMTIKASPTTYGNIFRQAATDENARLVIKAGNNNGEFLRNMIKTEGMYNGEHIVVE